MDPLLGGIQMVRARRFGAPPRISFCLDRQAGIQATALHSQPAGLVIALLTSYDQISLPAGASLQLRQQWGV